VSGPATPAEFFDSLDAVRADNGLTHGLHPYPAKFIPQIPRVLIESFSAPGDMVLDPMCGSGTTLVEAMALNRNAVGNDINPISVLVSRAKTTRLDDAEMDELSALADRVEAGDLPSATPPEFLNREHWFSDDASVALAELLAAVDGLPSERLRTLARATFSAILVGVSNQDSETRWSRVERSPSRAEVLAKYSRHLRSDLSRVSELARLSGSAEVFHGDARKLPLEDQTVDLLVTSPPYANSHDYYLYNKLRMFWLGFDVRATREGEFGSRNKHSDKKLEIDHYLEAMAGVFAEAARVLKPGARACVVVGDAVVRGEFFDMGEMLPASAARHGLTQMEHHKFDQKQFTRTFSRGFGTALYKSTHVLVFSR